jgi:hypothetical protein
VGFALAHIVVWYLNQTSKRAIQEIAAGNGTTKLHRASSFKPGHKTTARHAVPQACIFVVSQAGTRPSKCPRRKALSGYPAAKVIEIRLRKWSAGHSERPINPCENVCNLRPPITLNNRDETCPVNRAHGSCQLDNLDSPLCPPSRYHSLTCRFMINKNTGMRLRENLSNRKHAFQTSIRPASKASTAHCTYPPSPPNTRVRPCRSSVPHPNDGPILSP